LLIGSRKEVIDYSSKLKSGQDELFSESSFSIFSPKHMIREIAYFRDNENEAESFLGNNTSLLQNVINNGSVVVENPNGDPLALLSLNSSTEELPIASRFSLEENAFPIDQNSITSLITAYRFDGVEKQFKQSLDIEELLSINDLQAVDGELTFSVDISSQLEDGVYYFIVDVLAEDLAAVESTFWNDWNWNPDIDDAQDGGKTENLTSFLTVLRDSVEQKMVYEDQKYRVIGNSFRSMSDESEVQEISIESQKESENGPSEISDNFEREMVEGVLVGRFCYVIEKR
jgi:hypothetical protein